MEELGFSVYLLSRLADYKESCESGHPKDGQSVSPSTLYRAPDRGNLKTQQPPVILHLCLSKTRLNRGKKLRFLDRLVWKEGLLRRKKSSGVASTGPEELGSSGPPRGFSVEQKNKII